MAENSGIEWTHHTFNPWTGCQKVSAACDNCYAEEWDKRYNSGTRWGPKADRVRTSPKNWNLPLRWDKSAEKAGVRFRVFCASLADVFDNHKSILPGWRQDLWDLIRKTHNLDWLLLTKRPQNIKKMLPEDWGQGWPNVWLGTTVEDQEQALIRIPHLVKVPAAVRFLSCEPLLGPIELFGCIYEYADGFKTNAFNDEQGVNWVIAGGESGSHFRYTDPDWFRLLRDQCLFAEVPFLFKQWSGPSQATIKNKGRKLDGVVWDQYPSPKRIAEIKKEFEQIMKESV